MFVSGVVESIGVVVSTAGIAGVVLTELSALTVEVVLGVVEAVVVSTVETVEVFIVSEEGGVEVGAVEDALVGIVEETLPPWLFADA